jgi:hypothetical protein
MDNIPPQIICEICSFITLKHLLVIEVVSDKIRQKIKNNPYFVQIMTNLPDQPRKTYDELREYVQGPPFEFGDHEISNEFREIMR